VKLPLISSCPQYSIGIAYKNTKPCKQQTWIQTYKVAVQQGEKH
jgi:hypothetical protein